MTQSLPTQPQRSLFKNQSKVYLVSVRDRLEYRETVLGFEDSRHDSIYISTNRVMNNFSRQNFGNNLEIVTKASSCYSYSLSHPGSKLLFFQYNGWVDQESGGHDLSRWFHRKHYGVLTIRSDFIFCSNFRSISDADLSEFRWAKSCKLLPGDAF